MPKPLPKGEPFSASAPNPRGRLYVSLPAFHLPWLNFTPSEQPPRGVFSFCAEIRRKLALTEQPFVVIMKATKQPMKGAFMQKNMTDRTPGSYDDFVAYLGTVRTEEELFSRLTYWFAGQNPRGRPQPLRAGGGEGEGAGLLAGPDLPDGALAGRRQERAGSGGPGGVPEPHRRGLRRLPGKRPTRPGRASGTAAAPRPSTSPPTASRTSPSRT